jgi:hypothetical protein
MLETARTFGFLDKAKSQLTRQITRPNCLVNVYKQNLVFT